MSSHRFRATQGFAALPFGERGCGNRSPVTAIVVLVVLAAVVIGLGTAFGGPLIGVILAAALIIGGLLWFFALAGSKTTTGEVVREAPDQEFFGPGGPDDPNR